MAELASKTKPHRGHDFLLGFVSTLGIGIAFLFLIAATNAFFIEICYPGVFLLLLGLMGAVSKGRRHIAFGILTATVAVPLFLIAIFAGDGWTLS